jgi:pyruvate formate lyase activating enzyme
MIHDAMLWAPLEGGKAACALCAHRCVIAPSKAGICGVRENRGGKLVTLVYGEVIAAHVDPIEKKPLYHFFPGSKALSIATPGCNFHCAFCQNWEISQAPRRKDGGLRGSSFAPGEIVREALAHDCRSISYTYTEPTIFFEYAYDTARLAREAGLANNFVTNGYMTEEALRTIHPYLDAANVDLKAFKDETYKKVCGARLEHVLETIVRMKELGVWVEVTTLVVPGLNDGAEELTAIARFIAGVDRDIPWHISRFHPDYEYTDAPATPVRTLRAAHEIGKREGLRYIYIGNIEGESEDTLCPTCGQALVRRQGFVVAENRLTGNSCPFCAGPIAGLFA